MKPERFTRNIRDEQDYCEFEVKDCPYQSIYDFKDYEEIEDNVDCELTLAIDKLGELEDIEQYYGVSLVTLYNALKNGVYVKVENIIWYIPAEYVSINKGMLFCDYNIPTYVLPKDKGKTWALTKEELEK